MNRAQLLTVALDESDDDVATTHRTVLAGLPERWRISRTRADAVVVLGGHADWPSRVEAAIAAGVRGVLVTRPVWTSPAAVAALAAGASAAHVRIAVESAFLADPSWKRFLPALREHAARAALVDSLRTVPTAVARGDRHSLGPYRLEQLAVLRKLVGPLSTVALGQQATEQYSLSVESADRVLNIVGVRAASDQLTLDLIRLAQRWRVSFDKGAVARPTTVEMMDASGIHAAPAIYQTGQRCAWLELHEAITHRMPVSYDLALLGECLRLTTPSADELAPTSTSGLPA